MTLHTDVFSSHSQMTEPTHMTCWMFLRRPSSLSRLGYHALPFDGHDSSSDDPAVTVVVGREKRVFMVDPFVLENDPFRVLMGMVRNEDKGKVKKRNRGFEGKDVIFVDVDAILFEHMLWLVDNDCSSLFQLNFEEIIEFYAQDYKAYCSIQKEPICILL